MAVSAGAISCAVYLLEQPETLPASGLFVAHKGRMGAKLFCAPANMLFGMLPRVLGTDLLNAVLHCAPLPAAAQAPV